MQAPSQRATALRYALEQAEFPPDASHDNCGRWFQDLVGSHPWKLVLSNWSETGNIEYLLSLLANFARLAKMESVICPLKPVMEVTLAEVARLCNDLWFSLIPRQATTDAPENHKRKLADMLEGTIPTNVDLMLGQVDIPATLKLLKRNDLQNITKANRTAAVAASRAVFLPANVSNEVLIFNLVQHYHNYACLHGMESYEGMWVPANNTESN
ncbi:hypothetical protein BT69DRAFT_1296807 [Atractiella rhizophila]|nr:hypothetical protein BT69DRAFT_1296807 [Atractiella rhizophila]